MNVVHPLKMAHTVNEQKTNNSAPVNLMEDMICLIKKKHFLGNPLNKQPLINLLSMKFEGCGISVLHAKADADVLIVETAIKLYSLSAVQ